MQSYEARDLKDKGKEGRESLHQYNNLEFQTIGILLIRKHFFDPIYFKLSFLYKIMLDTLPTELRLKTQLTLQIYFSSYLCFWFNYLYVYILSVYVYLFSLLIYLI